MAETRSDSAVLRAVATKYDTAVATAKGTQTMLQGVVDASKASFSGDAALAFNASALRWQAAATAYFATVDAVGKAIHTAAGKYDVEDETHKASFSALRL